MADPLTRRVKKWTYLTWCDLRNHPLMLVGCFLGALAFGFFYLQTDDTKNRVQGVERTVKVPRRCTVAHIPHTPTNVVILFCNPATKREIAAAQKKKAAKVAKALHRKRARAKSGTNRHSPQAAPGSPNGSPGISPPSSARPPSRSPPAGSPSGGGPRTPAPSPSPPQRAAPGVTTPPLGPVPPLTVPFPSLPPLPLGQLTGR
jgi:hypothetical protein